MATSYNPLFLQAGSHLEKNLASCLSSSNYTLSGAESRGFIWTARTTKDKYVHKVGRTGLKTFLATNMKNYLQVDDTILFLINLLFVDEKLLFTQWKSAENKWL